MFPQASFAGCFCNGEIGPTPPDELEPAGGTAARMMGYSTGDCSHPNALGLPGGGKSGVGGTTACLVGYSAGVVHSRLALLSSIAQAVLHRLCCAACTLARPPAKHLTSL